MGKTNNFEGPDTLALRCIKTIMNRHYGKVDRGPNQGYERRLVTETKLLWAGKNYVMVREGPDEGSYCVVLYSRTQVFLKGGDARNNAMMEIALATLDPGHKSWADDYKRELWVSGKHGGGINELRHLRGRRFGKKLVAELVEFAEELDLTQEQRFAEFKQTRADQRRYANSVGKLFVELGVPVLGRDPKRYSQTKHYKSFVPQKRYSAQLGDKRSLKFTVHRSGQIEVKLDAKFSKEEMVFLAEAVALIHKNRAAKIQADQKDIA